MSEISPFTFINSINEGLKGKHLLDDSKADKSLEAANPNSIDKYYVPFIINRGMSYFKDTVLFANEMNMHSSLPVRMQYDFYRSIVVPKKRFSKWSKKAKDSDDLKLIMEAYSYNRTRAEEALKIMSNDDIKQLRQMMNKGGMKT